jgi:hypothetical protein
VKIRRLFGAALTVSVLLGGLLLVTVTAGPAAACSCVRMRSEVERAARADAIFVGTLVGGGRVDPSASAPKTRSRPFPAPVVFTFEVSRVYKGAVGQRQEIVTPGGGGAGCGGFGIGLRGAGPFLVFAHQSSNALYQVGPGQYGSSLCSGSRALADREPSLGGLPAREPRGQDRWPAREPRGQDRWPAREPRGQDRWPSTAGLVVGVGVLAAVVTAGVAILGVRRRASAD